MAMLITGLASDYFNAVNFGSYLAYFSVLVFFVAALCLGLLIFPKDRVAVFVRALSGMPVFFILGGALAGLLYYFGVRVFASGILLIVISVIIICITFIKKDIRDLLNMRQLAIIIGLILFSYFLAYFGWGETKDGTIRAVSGSWGDGVLHTLNAEAFKIRNGGDFSMPAFYGEKFHEPFGYDFVAGILLSLGFTIGGAFTIPAAGLLASLFALTAAFTGYLVDKLPNIKRGLKRNIKIASILLVSFGGGLQWVLMPKIFHLWSWKGFFGVHNPVWDKNEELGIAWANHLNTLISQKHLLLASTFLLVLGFFLYLFLENAYDSGRRKKTLLILAVSTAVLPFFHAHAFIAAALIWFFFWFLKQSRKIFILGLGIAIMSLPVFMSFGAAVSRVGFTTIKFGYLVDNDVLAWVNSWVINLGIFLPVAILVVLDKKWGKARLLIAMPVVILFLLGNTIQFQPYLWDNFKIFLFAWFLFLPFVVAQVVKVAKSVFLNKEALVSLSLALVFISLVLTTVSETYTFLTFRYNYPLFLPAERKIAKKMDELFPTNAVVLAGTDTYHKNPVTLTGRNLMLGYAGWIWTRGMDLKGRQLEIAKILNSNNNFELCSALRGVGVTHIVVDSESALLWEPKSSDFVTKAFGLKEAAGTVTVLETSQFCN